MPSNLRSGAAGLAALALASMFSVPACAGILAFKVQLGSDGIGHFIYDDDDGGPNAGFTKFVIDLSPALGPAYAAISPEPLGSFGPGGSFAPYVFAVLTEPLTLPLVGVSFGPTGLTVPIELSFLNMGWPNIFGPLSHRGSLCTVPGILASQYGFCTADASGVGDFITSADDIQQLGVPEPAPWTLLLGSFGLLAFSAGRRTAPGA